MTLGELRNRENLSVRSFNICRYNKLKTLSDILAYYNKHKSFENLRNCGRRSNEELISLCKKHQSTIVNSTSEQTNKDPLEEILPTLTRVQRSVINSFIAVNTEGLSVRSRNAISLYLNNNLKIKHFAEKILCSESFNVNNIKNVGKKSIPELEVHFSIIKDFIFEVNQTKDEERLISLKNKFLIQRTFNITRIPNEILETESIFLLTDFLINSYLFFDKIQTIILQKALNLYNNQKESTLGEIAELVDLSRERVRQIRKFCLGKLFEKLLFFSNFNEDLFQKYNIDTESEFIEINQDILKRINNSNNTHFSKGFITYILSVYLKDSFAIVGNYEDVLQHQYSKARKRHNWRNLYLVDKELISEVDFTSFADDISERLNDRIEESYSFQLKSYLSGFLINKNIDILSRLCPIAEKIINDEFDLYLDLDDNLVFKRNTPKQAFEYSYEALEELAKPSKVEEITKKIIELYPNYKTDKEKVRASMKRKDGFVPVGRKSVFALKKWEKELENFKGGTIRDIVEEYLEQFLSPVHISEITEYVLKYRPRSNQYSILQNLKLDTSGIFSFFKNSHIGLSSKRYETNFEELSRIKKADKKTWEESFELLKFFIHREKRLPFSSGVSEKEKKLYRWLNVQKNKKNKGKLDKGKKERIRDLIEISLKDKN